MHELSSLTRALGSRVRITEEVRTQQTAVKPLKEEKNSSIVQLRSFSLLRLSSYCDLKVQHRVQRIPHRTFRRLFMKCRLHPIMYIPPKVLRPVGEDMFALAEVLQSQSFTAGREKTQTSTLAPRAYPSCLSACMYSRTYVQSGDIDTGTE
jgi:hypothetical protein